MDHIATRSKPLQVCLVAQQMCQQKKLQELRNQSTVICEEMGFKVGSNGTELKWCVSSEASHILQLFALFHWLTDLDATVSKWFIDLT